jgi:AraC-like DNA-binding protein
VTALRYSVHPPPPPLAALVDYFWSLSDAPSHSRERIIPSGTIELVINLQHDEIRVFKPSSTEEECVRLAGAVVSGAYGGAFVIDTHAHGAIVGVHFKPGGAATILGVPAGALADAHVELDALWGRRAIELRERLCAAADSAQRFWILEQALMGLLPRAPNVRGEVDMALGRLGAPGVEVAEVAKDVQLSHRRFIELFTEQVGMTPKRYSRVRRLQHALTLVTSRGSPAWAEVALACGYYDQAHLCRDWVELTGLSPMEFLRSRSVHVKDNHVAVLERSRSNFSNTSQHAARNLRASGRRNASREA